MRALLVDLDGHERGSAVVRYRHGQIIETLPTTGERLPPEFALQHPADWLDSAAQAVRRGAQAVAAHRGRRDFGIGVDFTSCTMLPARRDGTPLCLVEAFAGEPLAWPKLWKHHGAQSASRPHQRPSPAQRGEPWLARYGGIIGLEWFFPKVLETLEAAPHVYDAAEVWLEAGDWFVWQLVGGPRRRVAALDLPGRLQGDVERPRRLSRRANSSPPCIRSWPNVVARKMPGRLLSPRRSRPAN